LASAFAEYLVKGFTMDDERLKNPPGPGHTDYFDELLEWIRDIRASERRFYQKVLDIYATSVDYQPDIDLSQQFFATVQNKMHWAVHGHTAAEIQARDHRVGPVDQPELCARRICGSNLCAYDRRTAADRVPPPISRWINKRADEDGDTVAAWLRRHLTKEADDGSCGRRGRTEE
jgi:hypothetical protein